MKKKLFIGLLFIFLCFFMLFGSVYLVFLFNPSKIPVDIKLNGSKDININVFDDYVEPGYTAKLGKKDVTKKIKIINNVKTDKPGLYRVTYTYSLDNISLKKSVYRNVKVLDAEPPVLDIDAGNSIVISKNSNFDIPKAKAIDNYDGDISKKIIIDSNVNQDVDGKYRIIYTVEDSSGNKANKEVEVVVSSKNPRIDIYISKQKLYYYEYGKVVLSSDVVTGINNGTPLGHYKVRNKARNVTLKGKDYTSYVNYWISFIGSSYGMHDASWRNSFGGTIYKYNGSHGCVNMPYYKVKSLYNMVSIGTPVNIYS